MNFKITQLRENGQKLGDIDLKGKNNNSRARKRGERQTILNQLKIIFE